MGRYFRRFWKGRRRYGDSNFILNMQEHQNDLPPNVSDHDLLIVLHTTIKHMARDISSIKDEAMQRLAVMEATKYDKEDAIKAIHDAEKVHDAINDAIATKYSKEDASALIKAHSKIHEDHEARMRNTERTIYLAVGGLAVLQIILGMM